MLDAMPCGGIVCCDILKIDQAEGRSIQFLGDSCLNKNNTLEIVR